MSTCLRRPSRVNFRSLAIIAVCGLSHALFAVQAATAAAKLTFYVSPQGNDAWSGRLSEPNPHKTDGPVATIQQARDLVRAAKAGGPAGTMDVILRGGVYRQAEPIVFTAADSGTAERPICYRAFPGEEPIVSGGLKITGWQPDDSQQSRTRCGGKLWKAVLPDSSDEQSWRFNQLFVNGNRAKRARVPNKDHFFRTDGPIAKDNSHGFYFHGNDVQQWSNPREVIFVLYHSWETSTHHPRAIDTQSHLVELHESAPWGMGRWERQQRYYVENVFEELDQPGEWYLDRANRTVYYYPLDGEKLNEIDVIAPVLTSTLVNIEADAAKGETVEHLCFNGISFAHSNSNLRRLRNPGQGEIYQPALIMAAGLRNSQFVDCTVAHTGAHGIWLTAGCENVRIERCHLHDLGGGGVYIGGTSISENALTQHNVVDNCFIHDGSYMFHGAHGVWIGKSSYNTVTHNEISNLDYSGISCGWSWGFQPSSAHHNILDYNHIHHLSNGAGLSDMGGIYTLGISPGTTERFNHMHHIYNYEHVSHGSGVYPDEGSSDILIENNVVYKVRTCPLFQHYGKDNLIRNNIFAYGGKGQIQRCRDDKPCHYVAEGNIAYGDIPDMLGGRWKSGDWKLGNNVYWSTSGEPRFDGMDFATWQTKWKEVGSIVADPQFVDPEHFDFRLRSNSPALKLGFKPIDLSNTGLYGDPQWVALPQQYPNRPLTVIEPPVEPPFVINFDFEADQPHGEPLDGRVVDGGKKGSLAISDETAAGGKQSLKFTDADGLKYSWAPHLYYNQTITSGKVLLSWDMLNSAEQPGRYVLEVRDWDQDPYIVGPTVSVEPDGSVKANGKALGVMPLGRWVHVDIALQLGAAQTKNYHITLTAANSKPISADVPYNSSKFQKVTWFGVTSNGAANAVFYLDNLKLGTPEQLAATPVRRPRVQSVRQKRNQPGNNQKLSACWNFNETESYVAVDSSGFGNDGDVWASWAAGDFGSAVYCDLNANTVIVEDDPSLHFGKGAFSIELWISPTQLGIDSHDKRRRFMDKNAYPNTWWNMNVTPEGKAILEMVDSNKVGFRTQTNGSVAENAWAHLVVVVDRPNGEAKWYLNGKLDKVQQIPSKFGGDLDVKGRKLTLGSSWQPFIGLLDEVKIYKRALSRNEITASYESQKANRVNAVYRIVE